ncbi:hypothetical protein FA13DRAFT_1802691 [Coprinellus micaceus]|uniref:F-box domain-containing protein n=1 Tax=Coprinellus micaceus TaxID=71717 RepID=A0A4Y7SC73_COPMI|nr:hypothetical protein FA13DRAFT_1802691 [Coprinellus micaceus]
MAENTQIDSPFSHRFTTNYVASPEEVPLIEQIIQDHKAIIHDLRDEVEELDGAIAELVRRKKEVESWECRYHTSVAHHAGLLAPARLIPPEILSVIFRLLPHNLEFAKTEGSGDSARNRDLEAPCKQELDKYLTVWHAVRGARESALTDLPDEHTCEKIGEVLQH